MKKKLRILIICLTAVIIFSGIAALFIKYDDYDEKKKTFSGLGKIYAQRRGIWEAQHRERLFFKPEEQLPMEETAHLPSYNIIFSTQLADRSFFRVKLLLRFDNPEGVREARRQSERIQHAMNIVFSPYTREELGSEERDVLMLSGKIIKKYIKTELRFLYLEEYTLRGGIKNEE